MSGRLRWVSILMACSLAALVASVTTADTPVPGGLHTGNYGEHYLLDTAEYPGVHCSYGNDQFIDTMRIKPPVVFAYNSSAGTNQQTVGWRYFIEQSLDSVSWSLLASSTIHKAIATDAHNAHFTPRLHNFGSLNTVYLRVFVRTLWYRSGSVVARADHRFDYYRMDVPAFGAGFTDDDDNCLYFYT